MIRALLVLTATVVLCTLAAGCGDSSNDRAEHDKGPKPVPTEPLKPSSSSVTLSNRGSAPSGSGGTAPTTPPAGGTTNNPGGGK